MGPNSAHIIRMSIILLNSLACFGCGQSNPPNLTPSISTHPPTVRPSLPIPSPNEWKPAPPPSFTKEVGNTFPIAEAPTTSLPKFDAQALRQAGISKHEGKYITLLTDNPAPEMAALPGVFDRAVEEWRKYLGVKETKWQVQAHVMTKRETFVSNKLWRDELTEMKNGFAFPDALWLMDQPQAEYYRRHLLLHEGVHAFMLAHFQDCGPPWYMEGMAELLATHQDDGQSHIARYFPRNTDETPHWGRIKLVKDDLAVGKQLSIPQILDFPPQAHLQNRTYGWCWALAAWLDAHPRYQARFRQLSAQANAADFNDQFRTLFQADQASLAEEWQLFLHRLDYGDDIAREAIDFRPGQSSVAPGQPQTITIQAARGWQSSGLLVEAGTIYHITAQGRYQIAHTSKPWPCEPNGVSLRYYQGQPLGLLLAAVQSDFTSLDQTSGLLRPVPIGLQATFTPTTSGTLYFRVNDSSSGLHDNSGELQVTITR